ncbi:MAG: TetR/AcrR family transcriptional regulator [Actinopolymorphaceae bacterium]
MARLTRAELQERNRATVLAAARDEFTERGFRGAKIDNIAARADLTRGAVYSNFPGKRALYFAVLAEDAAVVPPPPHPRPGRTVGEALGAFTRAWLARLPLATDHERSPGRLGMDLIPEVAADERTRLPYAQLTALDAILLGLALERTGRQTAPLPGAVAATGASPDGTSGAGAGRLVGVAEAVLTTLHGASQLAAAAPGFVEPFHIISACEQLADLDIDDVWRPPHLPYIPPARPVDEPWSPVPAIDAFHGEPARLSGDGVVAILGLHRLSAVEEAIRAAPSGAAVTAVLVSSSPRELIPLARLVIADLRTCLFHAFEPSTWPRLQIVYDQTGALAAAAGTPAVSDATETAVRIKGSRIIARAEGFGACHAAATAGGAASP